MDQSLAIQQKEYLQIFYLVLQVIVLGTGTGIEYSFISIYFRWLALQYRFKHTYMQFHLWIDLTVFNVIIDQRNYGLSINFVNVLMIFYDRKFASKWYILPAYRNLITVLYMLCYEMNPDLSGSKILSVLDFKMFNSVPEQLLFVAPSAVLVFIGTILSFKGYRYCQCSGAISGTAGSIGFFGAKFVRTNPRIRICAKILRFPNTGYCSGLSKTRWTVICLCAKYQHRYMFSVANGAVWIRSGR
jgi:hypothetical protein